VITLALVCGLIAGAAFDRDPCQGPVPAESVGLQQWLSDGCYAHWAAWPQVRESNMGSGGARVFLNATLSSSLLAESERHPVGAAAVRELYGPDLITQRGWSVTVKTAAGGVDGQDWFFFEVFDGRLPAEPNTARHGARGCTFCHSQGADFVRSSGGVNTPGMMLAP